MNKTKSVDMIHGPMFMKIILFALPLALSSILQLLFNAADTIVVGRFAGKEALAAVGSNGALINLIVNLFMGLSIGCNVVVARYVGRGNHMKVQQTVQTSILVSVLGGILMGMIGFIIAPKLLIVMGTPVDVIELSSLYLKIYFMGMPFLGLYNFGAAILRSVGDTKRPLFYLAISGVVNIVLNLILVIYFHMSVAGVAIATVVSQIISSLLVLRALVREPGDLHFDLKSFGFDKDIFKEITKVGLPAGLQGCVFSLSNVVIQSAVNSFGSIVVAGNSASSNIESFIYVTMNSFHQSAVTFSSQNYGAKQYHRCDQALMISLLLAMTFGTCFGLLFITFGEQLLSLYTSDPAVIAAGLVRMKYLLYFQALNGAMDVMVGGMRGIGYSMIPTVVSLSGVCVLRLVYIATVFKHVGTIGCLYSVYPITWAITVFCHVCCYLWARKQIRRYA